jgi:hypothetical protein
MKSQKERGFLTLQNRGKKPTEKSTRFLPQKFGHSFEHRNRDRFWSAFLTSQLEAKFEAAEAPVFQSVKRRAFLLPQYGPKVGRRNGTHSAHHFPGGILWGQTQCRGGPKTHNLFGRLFSVQNHCLKSSA